MIVEDMRHKIIINISMIEPMKNSYRFINVFLLFFNVLTILLKLKKH